MSDLSEKSVDLLLLQDEFFQNLNSKGRSINTLKNYKTDLHCFNQYLIKKQNNLSIDNFVTKNIEQYGEYLEEKYRSDNSRRRRVQALRLFFDFLVSKSLFQENPVRKIPTSPKFLDIPRPTPFIDIKTLWEFMLDEQKSPQEMRSLLASRNQVILLLVYGAGIKVSDLSNIMTSHIFIKKEKARVMISHPKRDPYTIPLPEIFTSVYDKYLQQLAICKQSSKVEFEQLLFNANPYRILSGGISARGIEVIFEDFRKKLMIGPTPKSLRQACIFKWLQQNIEESQIKEWMGVAPSYSLKPYKDHLSSNVYDDAFLGEIYRHYRTKAL